MQISFEICCDSINREAIQGFQQIFNSLLIQPLEKEVQGLESGNCVDQRI